MNLFAFNKHMYVIFHFMTCITLMETLCFIWYSLSLVGRIPCICLNINSLLWILMYLKLKFAHDVFQLILILFSITGEHSGNRDSYMIFELIEIFWKFSDLSNCIWLEILQTFNIFSRYIWCLSATSWHFVFIQGGYWKRR